MDAVDEREQAWRLERTGARLVAEGMMRVMSVPVEWRDAPAVILLRERIGYDPRLHLIDLWAWQERQLSREPVLATVLETAAGWRGQSGRLAEALGATGWTVAMPESLWLVRPWQEVLRSNSLASAGRTVADIAEHQRAAVRERVRRFRERKRSSEANLAAEAPGNVTGSVTGVTSNVTSVTCNAPVSSYSEDLSSSKISKDTENVTYVEQAVTAGNGDDPLALLFDDVPPVHKPRADVDEVWRVYAETVPRVRLTKQRQELIKRRLKEFTVEELCRSIRGYGKSAWHAGENQRGVKYQTLELWLRDAAHVEAGWRHGEASKTSGSLKQRGLAGIEEAWDAYESKG